MFNMTILDVAIGVIFIYLLLSLMCSAANEIIEMLLKKRAIDLERGIRELLVPGTDSGSDDVVQKLYNHPLVNGLFAGKYEDSRIASAKRYVMRTALPSYIPSRTFALALMDLVLPPIAGTPAVAPAFGVAAAPAIPGEPSGAAGATPPSAPADVKITLTEPPDEPLAPTAEGNPLLRLRNAVGASGLLNDHSKNALTTLIDAAGDDVAKARENIEGWYDNSMDRVSSWYKKRTQVVLMILGIFIAVTLNVDTITVVKRLSTDRALRESLVAAADAYSKANATATPPPTPALSPAATTMPVGSPASPANAIVGNSAGASTTTTTTNATQPTSGPQSGVAATATASPAPTPEACGKDKESVECKSALELQKRAAELQKAVDSACVDPNSADCHLATDVQKACGAGDSADCRLAEGVQKACKGDGKDSPNCKYVTNQRQLLSLGLPIGWDDKNDPKGTFTGWTWGGGNGGWRDQLFRHLLGWLLTALAISLGAPFWFDLLNKFMAVRSAVKPDKTSQQAST